jgi:hypothetical protein
MSEVSGCTYIAALTVKQVVRSSNDTCIEFVEGSWSDQITAS